MYSIDCTLVMIDGWVSLVQYCDVSLGSVQFGLV